jgi:hypothetical protein
MKKANAEGGRRRAENKGNAEGGVLISPLFQIDSESRDLVSYKDSCNSSLRGRMTMSKRMRRIPKKEEGRMKSEESEC